MNRRYAALKPFDTIDKADLTLMHDQFDGIKIVPAGKASDKVENSVDGRVSATANGTGK